MGDGDRPGSPAANVVERLAAATRRIASAATTGDAFQTTLDLITDPLPTGLPIDLIDQVAILKIAEQPVRSLSAIYAWDRRQNPAPLVSYGEGLALDALMRGDVLTAEPPSDGSGGTTCLFVPLVARGQLRGALMIGSQADHQFSAAEIGLYQIIAYQIAPLLGAEPDTTDALGMYGGSLVQNANEPIITTDRNGIITALNSAAETLYRYSAADVKGQHISVLVPASSRAELESWLRTVVEERRAIHADSEGVDKHGRLFQLSTSLSPIDSADGSIVGVAVFSMNNTERMSYLNTLQEERDLLEAILEATNDAIVLVDPARSVVTANLQFEVFFQLPRHQVVNRAVEVLIDLLRQRTDLPGELINILLTFVGDKYQSAGGDFELVGLAPRILIWYSAPVYAHDGMDLGRLFVFRDATKERQADRMKTEFVSLVSHELRTPVTSIRGFTDLILEGDAGPIDSRVREYLDIIQLNADRLISLINDVLDITRVEAGHVELRQDWHSIDAIIDSVVQTMYPLLEAREQCLVVRVAPNLPSAWVDKERIAQIVTNLLSNATKYTSNGGEISIEAHRINDLNDLTSGAPSNVSLPAILVSIQDTGIGIDVPDQSMLFTWFYRTEQASARQIRGTGLGLAIVKSFVELHGGRVWVQSEIDRGSTFYFTIPLVEGT